MANIFVNIYILNAIETVFSKLKLNLKNEHLLELIDLKILYLFCFETYALNKYSFSNSAS